MEKGLFNDSDAAEVQGLDDLGGGRVHDVKRKAGMMLEGLASKRRMLVLFTRLLLSIPNH